MDEIYQRRVNFIDMVINMGISVSEACRRVGFSRQTGYKIMAKFNDNGYDGLYKRSSAPLTTPTKISDTIKRKVIVKSLSYPTKGPKWVVEELNKDKIQISEGKVHFILKSASLSKQQDRKYLQLMRFQVGKNLDDCTITDLESDHYFKYRKLISNRLGESVLMFDTYAQVSHTKQQTRFFICLDLCGNVVMIYADLDKYFRPKNLDNLIDYNKVSDNFYKHAYTEPYTQILNKIFCIFDCEPKHIILQSQHSGLQIFQEQISEFSSSKVNYFIKNDFMSFPYVKYFFNYFKSNFLKIKLKSINHLRRSRELTGSMINDYLTEFLNNYNNTPIYHYPHLGISPYEYASRMENKKIYLPSLKEYLQFIRSKNEQKDKEKSNEFKFGSKFRKHCIT